MDSVSDYYSATQLRFDRWSALRETTTSLCREKAAQKIAALKVRINDLFEALDVIESYWAFPGMAAFDHMRRQFAHDNFDELSLGVSRVCRALTTGAYRRRTIPLENVEWVSHARFTATVERERYLLHRLTLHSDPQDRFIGAFLRPPLYSTAFAVGFGTLYTAVYRPRLQQMEVRWPGTVWPQSMDRFQEGGRRVRIPGAA